MTLFFRANLENHMEGKLEQRGSRDSRLVTRSSVVATTSPVETERSSLLTFQDMYGPENVGVKFVRNVSRMHLGTQLKLLHLVTLGKDLPGDGQQQNLRVNIVRELSLTPQKMEESGGASLQLFSDNGAY